MKRLASLTLALAALSAFQTLPARAEMIEHKTVFDVKFGILTIGKATFDIRFDEKNYILDATGKTAGVAEMVAPGTGEVESKGRIAENGVIAEKHEVVFFDKSKESQQRRPFSFSGSTFPWTSSQACSSSIQNSSTPVGRRPRPH